MSESGPNILYLVHDLSDPAVGKRSAVLRMGGAYISLAGFRRGDYRGEGVDLGLTRNGGFAQRIWAVLRETAQLRRHSALFEQADLVIARNLEMLAIAARGCALCEKPPPLVYECLDIHRLMLNKGPVGATLRALEGRLSKSACGLITSSPAFVAGYFEPFSKVRLPVRLVENKVHGIPAPPAPEARKPGPPWKIGWFGAIRCAKSLGILSELCRLSEGTIEVIIRGRPAYDQIPDFERIVDETPGMVFEGPYRNPDDLAHIYGDVHFSWAIDMYEEGQNSSWLLPNRLYEGGLYGCVPLAQSGVETGRALERLKIGVRLDDPLAQNVYRFFKTLTPGQYAALEQESFAVPAASWMFGAEECKALAAWLGEMVKRKKGKAA